MNLGFKIAKNNFSNRFLVVFDTEKRRQKEIQIEMKAKKKVWFARTWSKLKSIFAAKHK